MVKLNSLKALGESFTIYTVCVLICYLFFFAPLIILLPGAIKSEWLVCFCLFSPKNHENLEQEFNSYTNSNTRGSRNEGLGLTATYSQGQIYANLTLELKLTKKNSSIHLGQLLCRSLTTRALQHITIYQLQTRNPNIYCGTILIDD